jgi:uncharacterized membrane protein
MRVLVCSAFGLVVLAVGLVMAPWQLAVLIAWSAAAALLVIWIWWEVGNHDADTTRRVAIREDDSRAAAGLLLVTASVVSLAAVVIGLHRAARSSTSLEAALTVASLATVVLSWLVVHTVFALRYAHLYFAVDGEGGIEFPGGEPPGYADFAYVAFTIGMTFQVSDTPISARPIRRTATRHALLSYVFGAAIIASTISVLAGLVI